MPTKKLFVLTILSVFFTGSAFGFAIADMTGRGKYLPPTERERRLVRETKIEREVPSSSAEDFRVRADALIRNYVMALTEMSRNVARGGPSAAVVPVMNTRIVALSSAFNKSITQKKSDEMRTLWQNYTTAVVAYAQSFTSSNPVDRTSARTVIGTETRMLEDFYLALVPRQPKGVYNRFFETATTSIQQAIDAGVRNDPANYLIGQQLAADDLGRVSDTLVIALATLPTTSY